MTFNFDLKSLTKAVDINASIAHRWKLLWPCDNSNDDDDEKKWTDGYRYHHSGCLMWNDDPYPFKKRFMTLFFALEKQNGDQQH